VVVLHLEVLEQYLEVLEVLEEVLGAVLIKFLDHPLLEQLLLEYQVIHKCILIQEQQVVVVVLEMEIADQHLVQDLE
jgi:hypothetical protein